MILMVTCFILKTQSNTIYNIYLQLNYISYKQFTIISFIFYSTCHQLSCFDYYLHNMFGD